MTHEKNRCNDSKYAYYIHRYVIKHEHYYNISSYSRTIMVPRPGSALNMFIHIWSSPWKREGNGYHLQMDMPNKCGEDVAAERGDSLTSSSSRAHNQLSVCRRTLRYVIALPYVLVETELINLSASFIFFLSCFFFKHDIFNLFRIVTSNVIESVCLFESFYFFFHDIRESKNPDFEVFFLLL